MASSRSKPLKNSTSPKKSESQSPEIPHSRSRIPKLLDSGKFTPILTRKSISSRSQLPQTLQNSTKPSVKPTSLNSSTVFPLSTVSCSQLPQKKTPQPVLSSSNSLNILQSNKIPDKKTRKKFVKTLKKPFTAEAKTTPKVKTAKITLSVDKLWRKVINLSNGIEPYAGSSAMYTAWVGKGNNHPMVKRILLARPWWKIVENKENANFVWAQWRDKQFLMEMKCFVGKNAAKEELGTSLANQVIAKSGKTVELDTLGLNLIQKSKSYLVLNSEKIYSEQQRLHNKFEYNFCLTNKKGLYETMKVFYDRSSQRIFDKLPVTFNVSSDQDPEFQNFLQAFEQFESLKTQSPVLKNMWIVKPGEFTNRGTGITVCKTLQEILTILKPLPDKTYIIQKYIENPLLINKRKFDIRCYALMTSINGVLQGYFYLDGYLRTTSEEFSVEESNPFVHLTNDAIQKHSVEYGKFENGNKLSYREFQKYLNSHSPDVSFYTSILPKIKEIVQETMQASFLLINKNKRLHCMEIFGYDFMIDQEFRPWLIEVNTNPCLELAAPHLRLIIPAMVENAFRLVLDSLFPAPMGQHLEMQAVNRFELIFHSELYSKQHPALILEPLLTLFE